MVRVILDVVTTHERRNLKPGDDINISSKVAERWVKGGIAHYPEAQRENMEKDDLNLLKIRIINNSNWILGKIADELLKIKYADLNLDKRNIYSKEADINYYINWQRFSLSCPKSKFDIVWFSHICKPVELEILKRADLIISQSEWGKGELLKNGFDARKIKVAPPCGKQEGLRFNKIKLGFAGKLYESSRKGEGEFIQLANCLDENIFSVVVFGSDDKLDILIEELSKRIDTQHIGEDSHKFFNSIDYFVSTSTEEGGPLDLLNASFLGIPIVAKDTGNFKEVKTSEDFLYENFNELLGYFKKIEKVKLAKSSMANKYTWDNFRNWHIDLFKEIAERK